MKKLTIILVFLISVMIPVFCFCMEETDEKSMLMEFEEEYSKMYAERLREGLDSLNDFDVEEIMSEFDLEELMSQATRGQLDFSPAKIVNTLLSLLVGEVLDAAKIMGLIIALALLCSLLTNLGSSFENGGVSQIAFFACFTLIVAISIGAFYSAVIIGQRAIDNIVIFMQYLVPLIVGAIVMSGAPLTATAFQPLVLGFIEISVYIIKNVFLPLLMFSAVLSVVNNLSEQFKVEKLALFIQKMVKWGLGIILTLFVGVLSIQSIAAPSVDGLALRGTKFAVGNFIPVVGGTLADSIDTVIGCSLVLKNSVGIVGIIIIAFIALSPVLKMCAQLIVFNLAGAISEPVGDKRISSCICSLAQALSILLGMLAAVTAMFIVVLAIMIMARA